MVPSTPSDAPWPRPPAPERRCGPCRPACSSSGWSRCIRGLARLRHDIQAGQAPRRAGSATVLSWAKQAESEHDVDRLKYCLDAVIATVYRV